ncbi:MAG: hypothetical protein AAF236_15995 [Verrucomicrobiota bacterium]
MKPHRRKSKTPRKGPSSPPAAEAVPEANLPPQIPAQPAADSAPPEAETLYPEVGQEAQPIDPAAVDPSLYQQPAVPDPAAYDPNAAAQNPVYDPGAAPAASAGGGVYDESAPPQAYDPTVFQQGAADPGQALADSSGPYPGTGAQPTVDPNAGLAQPAPTPSPYEAPAAPSAAGAGVYDESGAAAPAPVPPPPIITNPAQQPGPAPAAAPINRPLTGGSPARRRPAGTRYQKKPKRTGEGFSFMTVMVALVAVAMLAAAVWALLPRDMSGVAGFPVNPLTDETPPNLLAEVQGMMTSRGQSATYTEEEINAYINHRLDGDQGGMMSALFKYEGTFIDLRKNEAEVFVVRRIFGQPVTASAEVRVSQTRGKADFRTDNWTVGRWSLGAMNVKPLIGVFLRMRDTLDDEWIALLQMGNVSVEDGQVTLGSAL